MDLIYTNSSWVDLGVLNAYLFDLSFGADENNFEITLEANAPVLDSGALIYIENTEYGGIVDGIKATTGAGTITYFGRTWHGVLNSFVIEPPKGAGHYIADGEAHDILNGLLFFNFEIHKSLPGGLFSVNPESSGLIINGYQFDRYCKGYEGICKMLSKNGGKLTLAWFDRSVRLTAKPIEDYSEKAVDNELALLSVEKHDKKINHLVCLGKGELTDREVIHLYVDQFGRIGDTKYYTGVDEITEVYEDVNTEDLRNDGIAQLEELRKVDTAEISLSETDDKPYDIGDIVGAVEYTTNVSVTEKVTQKIIRILNGIVSIEYKTGG